MLWPYIYSEEFQIEKLLVCCEVVVAFFKKIFNFSLAKNFNEMYAMMFLKYSVYNASRISKKCYGKARNVAQ